MVGSAAHRGNDASFIPWLLSRMSALDTVGWGQPDVAARLKAEVPEGFLSFCDPVPLGIPAPAADCRALAAYSDLDGMGADPLFD